MLEFKLKELGFTESEAKVYLALLELGASFVSSIAKKAGVERVGCYHTLNKLVDKGVVSSFTRDKVKYFSVDSPEILVGKAELQLEKTQKLLPELLSITNALAYKPKVNYYEGFEGIKNIFEDTLSAEGELLGYTNLAKLPEVLREDYLKSYAQRKVENGIKSRMLSPNSAKGLKYLDSYYPEGFDRNLVEILFVNPEEFGFEYEITIYDDKVGIVSLDPGELMGMIIQSRKYADTQRGVFNLAWLGATAFVAK